MAEATRKLPSTLSGYAKSDLDKFFRIALYVVGGLIVAVLFYAYVFKPSKAWVNAPASHSTSVGRSTVTNPVRTATCPGEVIPLPLTAAWTPLPKGNSCRIVHEIEVGEVEFADHRGKYAASGWQSRNPIMAHAPYGQAFIRISWCPLDTGVIPIKWDCTPKT